VILISRPEWRCRRTHHRYSRSHHYCRLRLRPDISPTPLCAAVSELLRLLHRLLTWPRPLSDVLMRRRGWSQIRVPHKYRSSSQGGAPQPPEARREGRACVCPLRRLALAVSASVSCAPEAIADGRPGRAVPLCRVRDRTSVCGRSS
jgi:hypothetical protein